MSKVKTEKELADAIKRGDETIEIEGSLASKTIKIRATGKVAWAIALGAIGIAVYSVIITLGSGGTTAPITSTASAFAAPAAVSILGVGTTYSAILIAVTFGGVGVLTSLREYKEVSRSGNKLVLKKR